MSREQGGKGKKIVDASTASGDVQQNSICGKYSETEAIAHLKRLALDPCNPQFARHNTGPLCNQILKLRKIMILNDSEIPWRKRKLEHFVKDKRRPQSSFAVPNQLQVSKLSSRNLSRASSVSCLVNSTISTQVNDGKKLLNAHSASSLLTFDRTFPVKGMSPTIDSNESVNGSMPPTPNNSILVAPKTENANHRLNSSILREPNKKHLKPPRQSNSLPNFIGDQFRRCVIPVGPRFQAEVPEWAGPLNRTSLLDQYKKKSDNSKWLGTQVWPTEKRNMKNSGESHEKGQSSSCCCISPGSIECFKHHCIEEREFIRCNLGPAFAYWKFDEMGDQVAKLWTSKEQLSFESVMKLRSSNGTTFVKRALKSIPQKSRKDIISYYFNVFIPHRLSLQTRSSSLQVIDSDQEDELDDFNYMGVRRRSERKAITTSPSKKMKLKRS